jgi:NAD(P)-dependent dehydrogenase (short-subunit alcohol dehydrogenase family)
MNLFGSPYKALVIGAGGAIGNAFFHALQADTNCTMVMGISRSQGTGFDLEDEESIARHADMARSSGPFQLIVDATGALTVNGIGPEKSLAKLSSEHTTRVFQINAIGPALVLRYFSPLLAPGEAIYAKLSARVGSIADNQKGGWYAYRASKAALNMFLQTAALELQRKNAALRVLALQPGTVNSALSQPFASTAPLLLDPQQSVAGLLAAMKQAPIKSGAYFVDHIGQEIPW